MSVVVAKYHVSFFFSIKIHLSVSVGVRRCMARHGTVARQHEGGHRLAALAKRVLHALLLFLLGTGKYDRGHWWTWTRLANATTTRTGHPHLRFHRRRQSR